MENHDYQRLPLKLKSKLNSKGNDKITSNIKKRSKSSGIIPELGSLETLKSRLNNEAIKIWNKAPNHIKESSKKMRSESL